MQFMREKVAACEHNTDEVDAIPGDWGSVLRDLNEADFRELSASASLGGSI